MLSVAGFITFKVLAGVKETIGRLDAIDQLRGWQQQVVLAKVVADLTGDTIARVDAEYIGQDMARWLDNRRSATKRRAKLLRAPPHALLRKDRLQLRMAA